MIKLEHLTTTYANSKKGLNDFDTVVSLGKIYGLLGKNGMGKTTLMRTIIGLLFPSQGNCEVHDYSSKLRHPDMLKEIGVVPEENHLPKITPQKYIRYWSKFYPRFDHKLMEQLLQDFGFPNTTSLARLSQGEKKKFIIAFTLSTKAKLLLFDEPTNGLDISSKLNFRNIIRSQVSSEQTLIIATHQIRDIDSLISDVMIIDQGKHVGDFPIEFIRNTFQVARVKSSSGAPTVDFEKGVFWVIEDNQGYWVLTHKSDAESQPEKDMPDLLEVFFSVCLKHSEQIKNKLTGYQVDGEV